MKQRGDTIVEVIFAITIFSLVAVGGLSLMNQGTAMAQRSLEIGLVRDQMDEQADALKYVHDAYVADYVPGGPPTNTATIWSKITSQAGRAAHAFSDMTSGQTCVLPKATGDEGSPFALNIWKLDDADQLLVTYGTNPNSGGVPVSDTTGLSSDFSSTTYAQVRDDATLDHSRAVAQGIWIQAVKGNRSGTTPGYYDFHIRACWLSPGQSTPITLGTIVRLYEPAS